MSFLKAKIHVSIFNNYVDFYKENKLENIESNSTKKINELKNSNAKVSLRRNKEENQNINGNNICRKSNKDENIINYNFKIDKNQKKSKRKKGNIKIINRTNNISKYEKNNNINKEKRRSMILMKNKIFPNKKSKITNKLHIIRFKNKKISEETKNTIINKLRRNSVNIFFNRKRCHNFISILKKDFKTKKKKIHKTCKNIIKVKSKISDEIKSENELNKISDTSYKVIDKKFSDIKNEREDKIKINTHESNNKDYDKYKKCKKNEKNKNSKTCEVTKGDQEKNVGSLVDMKKIFINCNNYRKKDKDIKHSSEILKKNNISEIERFKNCDLNTEKNEIFNKKEELVNEINIKKEEKQPDIDGNKVLKNIVFLNRNILLTKSDEIKNRKRKKDFHNEIKDKLELKNENDKNKISFIPQKNKEENSIIEKNNIQNKGLGKFLEDYDELEIKKEKNKEKEKNNNNFNLYNSNTKSIESEELMNDRNNNTNYETKEDYMRKIRQYKKKKYVISKKESNMNKNKLKSNVYNYIGVTSINKLSSSTTNIETYDCQKEIKKKSPTIKLKNSYNAINNITNINNNIENVAHAEYNKIVNDTINRRNSHMNNNINSSSTTTTNNINTTTTNNNINTTTTTNNINTTTTNNNINTTTNNNNINTTTNNNNINTTTTNNNINTTATTNNINTTTNNNNINTTTTNNNKNSSSTTNNNNKIDFFEKDDYTLKENNKCKEIYSVKDSSLNLNEYLILKEIKTKQDNEIIQLNLDSSFYASKGSGLYNYGQNICFFNSIIQAVIRIPYICKDLLNKLHSLNCEKRKKRIFCFYCLFEQFACNIISKKSVIKNILIPYIKKYICNSYHVGYQEDVHEYLRYFLCSLEKSSFFSSIYIQKMFTGVSKNVTICMKCNNVSLKYEQYYELSLDISSSNNLEDALNKFLSKELLMGENGYYCEKCKKKKTASKQCVINKLPRVLTIQIKRFFMNSNFHIVKNHKNISYPLYLDMKRYANNYDLFENNFNNNVISLYEKTIGDNVETKNNVNHSEMNFNNRNENESYYRTKFKNSNKNQNEINFNNLNKNKSFFRDNRMHTNIIFNNNKLRGGEDSQSVHVLKEIENIFADLRSEVFKKKIEKQLSISNLRDIIVEKRKLIIKELKKIRFSKFYKDVFFRVSKDIDTLYSYFTKNPQNENFNLKNLLFKYKVDYYENQEDEEMYIKKGTIHSMKNREKCNEEDKKKKKSSKNYANNNYFYYELTGLIKHIGSGTEYGHYVALTKSNNNFYLQCDDNHVSYINEKDILSCVKNAYVFIYTCINPHFIDFYNKYVDVLEKKNFDMNLPVFEKHVEFKERITMPKQKFINKSLFY